MRPLRRLPIAAALLVAGCGGASPAGCYDFDWPASAPIPPFALLDSLHLTTEPVTADSALPGAIRHLRVRTAVRDPDTASIVEGHVIVPRSTRWYHLFRRPMWARAGSDSLRIFAAGSSTRGDSIVLRAEVTGEGLRGEMTRFGSSYRQSGDSIVTVPAALGRSGFSARRIACPGAS
jgi:hypothetical protein